MKNSLVSIFGNRTVRTNKTLAINYVEIEQLFKAVWVLYVNVCDLSETFPMPICICCKVFYEAILSQTNGFNLNFGGFYTSEDQHKISLYFCTFTL